MGTTFIYFLQDPENSMKGYVGKTDRPQKRLNEHLTDLRGKTYRANWIMELAEKKLRPTLEIIDEVPIQYWPQLEAAYIQFFREEGFELVNGTNGGDGIQMTEVVRAKIGTAHLGKKRSPETCAKISAALTGKKPSPETLIKLSLSHLGKKATEASKKKVSASMLGKQNCLGHTPTPSVRAKLRIKRHGASSNFFGVSWNTKRKLWSVSISAFPNRIFLGRFSEEIDAAKAYDVAARIHHGEYAKLNFP